MTTLPRRPLVPEDETRLRRVRRRLSRHWRWGRAQGFGRLVEEDQLDPRERIPTAWRKWRWRRRHGVPLGSAQAVFLLGVQRSGTNMLVRGLEVAPEFEVHNENDRAAFERFRLRGDHRIAEIVAASRHRYVLFKPLCDSHRAVELLDEVAMSRRPLVVWAYRDVDGRARSALAKFGDVNLRVLADIASGRGLTRWQAQRLSPSTLEILRSFDYESMTPETGAALFWWLRNGLFFELGLAERPDVFLSSYDALIATPEPQLRALCAFLGFPYRPELGAHVSDRSAAGPRRLTLDPKVRELCDRLTGRLADAAAASLARTVGSRAPTT